MKALVLAGHLDDSVIAVGGIIRKIVDAGGQVDVVCFGNSDEDFDDVSKRDTCVARITAQADVPSDMYKFFFNANLKNTEGLTLSLMETEPDGSAGNTSGIYKIYTFRHNFPEPLTRLTVDFRVRKSWLLEMKIAPENIVLARMDGANTVLQRTTTGESNDEFVSFQAELDREGLLMILPRPTTGKR